MLELTEQARGYFERVSDPAGIFAPSDVFQKLAKQAMRRWRSITCQARRWRIDVRALPVEPLPTFAEDASEAVAELAELLAAA
jgi:transcription-repair coupling factor (superfamily II helicase)